MKPPTSFMFFDFSQSLSGNLIGSFTLWMITDWMKILLRAQCLDEQKNVRVLLSTPLSMEKHHVSPWKFPTFPTFPTSSSIKKPCQKHLKTRSYLRGSSSWVDPTVISSGWPVWWNNHWEGVIPLTKRYIYIYMCIYNIYIYIYRWSMAISVINYRYLLCKRPL